MPLRAPTRSSAAAKRLDAVADEPELAIGATPSAMISKCAAPSSRRAPRRSRARRASLPRALRDSRSRPSRETRSGSARGRRDVQRDVRPALAKAPRSVTARPPASSSGGAIRCASSAVVSIERCTSPRISSSSTFAAPGSASSSCPASWRLTASATRSCCTPSCSSRSIAGVRRRRRGRAAPGTRALRDLAAQPVELVSRSVSTYSALQCDDLRRDCRKLSVHRRHGVKEPAPSSAGGQPPWRIRLPPP